MIGKTELVSRYIKKYLDIAKKTGNHQSKNFISQVIYNEHPKEFRDKEEVRRYVRRIVGGAGKEVANKYEAFREEFLLLSEATDDTPNFEPYVYPKDKNKVLVIADIHGIFYDKKAVEIAISYGIKEHCNSVLIDGDLLDCYQYSKFDKDPRVSAYAIENEREWGQDFLKMLQNAFEHVVFKAGNHDKRRELEIQKVSMSHPDICQSTSLEDYLHFEGSNVVFIPDYTIVKLGKLNVIHGSELYGGGGVNVARNRLLKTFKNVLSAHSHVTMQYNIKDILGDVCASYTIGCLCNLHPRYAPYNQYNHGFATVEIEKDGNFIVNNREIIKGRLY